MKTLVQLYLLLGCFAVIAGSCTQSYKQWYLPANKTFKYHLTHAKTQYASCDTICTKQNISFSPFDDALLKFEKLKSVIMWVNKSDSACHYVLNGDMVNSKKCTYKFHCLCCGKTGNVTISSKTVPDSDSKENCSKTPRIMNFTYEHLNMSVTDKKTEYDNCSLLCGRSGSVVARVNDSTLQQRQFDKIQNVKLWVNNSDSHVMSRRCHISNHEYMLEMSNCSRKFRCLCQKEDYSAGSEENKTNPNKNNISEFSWVVGGDRQFFVYNVNLTFQNAAENCKKLEAAIVSFSNPSEYILLPRNKPLRGKYWVGECSKPTNNKCLTLEVVEVGGHTSLYSTLSEVKQYSICSRVANASEVLNHPSFVKMIKNMTIDTHQTTKMARKLNCARDERTSAKAIGAIVGTGVIAVVGSLLVLSDIRRIYYFIVRRM